MADFFDALIDNGLFDSKENGEAQRKLFQVSKALLSQKGDNINAGKYDDIFRPYSKIGTKKFKELLMLSEMN